jgi:hypothetical protein
MGTKWITRALAGALCLAAGAGCNPILLMAYLFNNNDPKMPAEFELKPRPKHEKDEVRVVVLTSNLPSVSPDMIGIDRLLAMEFVPLLEKRCQENKQKLTVLKSQPVEAYKREHPNWRRQSPYDIGEHFKADYVIDVEVLDVSLFDPGARELMKGRARVSVSAYDLSKPLKEPAYNPPEYNFEFPRSHEVPIHDMSITTFRQRFVKHMASELVLPFTAHTSNQKVNLN